MQLRNLSACLIFSSIYLFTFSSGQRDHFPNSASVEDQVVFKKYLDMDKQLKNLASIGIKMALPMMLEASERLNLTAKCMGNILLLTTGIRKLKLSAISFLDATGKPGAGFLEGSMHMLGDYDECLGSFMERRKGEIAFKGQYCLVHYSPLLPRRKGPVTFDSGNEELVEATRNASEIVRFLTSKAHFFYFIPAKFGICVPSGCNEHDVSQMVKYVSETIYVNATLEYCDADTDVFLDTRNITFMCCLVIIGILSVCGTIVDYYSKKNIRILKSFLAKFLLCFSIITNFPKAITTKVPENNIRCLNGIRVLTLFHAILGLHYYTNIKYFIASHSMKALDDIPKFFFQIIINGFITADAFFFLGGLVNCYTRAKKEEDKTQKTNFFYVYLHRTIRIIPPYMLFAFLMSLFRPHGPARILQVRDYVAKCDKYWWQNALFINNFFVQDDSCIPHSWFIAADMQLFLLSLFTVPILLKCPKRGIVVNSAMIICGIVLTIVYAWVNKITPAIVGYRPNNEEFNQAWDAHTTTFPHVAPYFTGILMGYFLATKQNIKISKIFQIIGWPVAALLFISMLFMSKIWNSGGTFTVVDSSFYFAFSKFLYVLGIAWMVLCCATGNGGVINYILSLPLWIPLSRISYLTYLIAPFLQNFYLANTKTIVDLHRMHLIWRYAGDIAISCILGLVLYVLMEAPFPAIEKLLFHKNLLLNETVIKPADIFNHEMAVGKKIANSDPEINQKKDVFFSVKNGIS